MAAGLLCGPGTGRRAAAVMQRSNSGVHRLLCKRLTDGERLFGGRDFPSEAGNFLPLGWPKKGGRRCLRPTGLPSGKQTESRRLGVAAHRLLCRRITGGEGAFSAVGIFPDKQGRNREFGCPKKRGGAGSQPAPPLRPSIISPTVTSSAARGGCGGRGAEGSVAVGCVVLSCCGGCVRGRRGTGKGISGGAGCQRLGCGVSGTWL